MRRIRLPLLILAVGFAAVGGIAPSLLFWNDANTGFNQVSTGDPRRVEIELDRKAECRVDLSLQSRGTGTLHAQMDTRALRPRPSILRPGTNDLEVWSDTGARSWVWPPGGTLVLSATAAIRLEDWKLKCVGGSDSPADQARRGWIRGVIIVAGLLGAIMLTVVGEWRGKTSTAHDPLGALEKAIENVSIPAGGDKDSHAALKKALRTVIVYGAHVRDLRGLLADVAPKPAEAMLAFTRAKNEVRARFVYELGLPLWSVRLVVDHHQQERRRAPQNLHRS